MIFRAIAKIKILFSRVHKRILAKRFSFYVCQVDSGKLKNSEKNTKKQETKFEIETVKRYEDLMKKRVDNNPLILVEVLSIKSIVFEFHNYHDRFPLLMLRRYLILGSRFEIISFQNKNTVQLD